MDIVIWNEPELGGYPLCATEKYITYVVGLTVIVKYSIQKLDVFKT